MYVYGINNNHTFTDIVHIKYGLITNNNHINITSEYLLIK